MTNEYFITLNDIQYTCELTQLEQKKLKFYIENPRVYSFFDRSEGEPTQEEMENQLCGSDDVRELRDSIRSNGGLSNPIFVTHDYVVIEGNRRLACYRMLYREDQEKWKMIPVYLLPSNFSDEAIFILLGNVHLIGQKPWAPFEKAGYIYRTIDKTGYTFDKVADITSMKLSEVKTYYNTYKFMLEHDDLESSHWSYYAEYLKSNKLKKMRSSVPDLDKKVVIDIKAGKLSDAKKDIRETLVPIADDSNAESLLSDYVSGNKDLDECYKEIDILNNNFKKTLTSFKIKIQKDDIRTTIIYSKDDDKEFYTFELKQIKNSIDYLLSRLRQEK